jgi:hypothetical protein
LSSAKKNIRQKKLGKEASLPSVKKKHLAKTFPSVFTLGKEISNKILKPNEFKSKDFQLQSCITSQDL